MSDRSDAIRNFDDELEALRIHAGVSEDRMRRIRDIATQPLGLRIISILHLYEDIDVLTREVTRLRARKRTATT